MIPIGDLPPAELANLVGEITPHRTTDTPFDVAIPSWTASAPPAAYEPAGVTWSLDGFHADTPLEKAQTVVQRGPRRAE